MPPLTATPKRRRIMARRKSGAAIDGVVLLDKPRGLSSNHALQRVRRAYGARKAGHTGSLDPLASGLLPVCLGEATKLSSHLLAADKSYRVVAALGHETTTGDAEGEPTEYRDVPAPGGEALSALLHGFVGPREQVPPMYSALKVDGKPLYAYAREGRQIERAPRSINVSAMTLVAADPGRLEFAVTVSGGTYVRTLVEDIARAWGGRAHVAALRRTAVGALGALGAQYPMVALAELEDEAGGASARAAALRPISALVAGWPAVTLDAQQAAAIGHGRSLDGDWPHATGPLCLHGPDGRLLGLGERGEAGELRPKRLFAEPQV